MSDGVRGYPPDPIRVAALLDRIRPRRAPDPDRAVYACRCLDLGMVEGLPGEWMPCAACNPRGHVLWRGGHWKLEHVGCDECRPKGKARRSAGTSHHDEVTSEREERNAGYRARERDDLF